MAKNLYYEDEYIEKHFNLDMLKHLILYAKRNKKRYYIVITLLITSSILSLIPSILNMQIINYVLPNDGVVNDKYLTYAICIISIWTAVFTGKVITSFFSQININRLGNTLVYDIRNELYEKLMRLSFDYYDGHPAGKILVRVTSYTTEVSNIFMNNLTAIVSNSFIMSLSIVGVFIIDYRIAFVVLAAMIPLSLLIAFPVRELHKRASYDRSKNSNRTAFIAEDINGVSIIQAFNRESLNGDIHNELCQVYKNAFMRTTHVREAFFPLSHGLVRIICTLVICAFALYLIMSGNRHGLTLGGIVSITSLMQMFSESMVVILQRMQNVSTLTANMERIFDTLSAEEKITDAEDSYELKCVKGEVEFKNIIFSYNGVDNVLENLNLKVKAGETVALVGPTGAGKTTIVNLLNRFYEPQKGQILIDGNDISKVTMESLRNEVGVMMQDTYMFEDTIMENIRFAKPDATDEECIAAAKKVYADKFIEKLPEKYETKINEGSQFLSGGERQILSFARLMLADPKIVVLDEATSNIDTETELKLQQMMNELMKGRTSFVIAHRLSTIRNADQIVYIHNKNIGEMGTHEELMEKKGLYYSLLEGNRTAS